MSTNVLDVSVSCYLGDPCSPVTTPEGGAVVRAEIRDDLARKHLDALVDDALLIVTELVSNANRHGAPPSSLTVWLLRDSHGRSCVRLEVEDSGAALDLDRIRARWRHPSFAFAGGGRGLFIVNALARSWGDMPSRHGHTVWAELESAQSDGPPAPNHP
ncbi:ATP-binding protein [Streptomyces hypolithicus]